MHRACSVSEIFYFAEGTDGAVRIDDWKFRLIDQPDGWLGATVKLDWPILSNLRLDPFERMLFPRKETTAPSCTCQGDEGQDGIGVDRGNR